MWIAMVQRLLPEARFQAPASADAIARCESAVGARLDPDLRALLAESNGIEDECGGGLVWSTQRIASDNQAFRDNPGFAQLYMPFDPLVFFADAGNGDQFAFVRGADRQDVFAWDHENDSRTWVAPNLQQYLTWWLDGTLSL